ncbi:MAG: hypothetical protein ACRDJW_05180 [Thermomicrobiales bacterium]
MSEPWPVESIPDSATVYMRVHKQYIKRGQISASCFKNQADPTSPRAGRSTDWSTYSTPEECRDRARHPRDNAVIELVVGDIRSIEGQSVEHTPIPNAPERKGNRAHTDVFGDKDDLEVKLRFRRCSKLILALCEG